MSEKIIRAVEQDRLKKVLPVYQEAIRDLTEKPTLNTFTYFIKSIPYLLFLAAITLASLSLYQTITSSNDYGNNFFLVDITDPYTINPIVPTLQNYQINKSKAYQEFVFRAGPGAQYWNVGGEKINNPAPTNTYPKQYFNIHLPLIAKKDQIVVITNASISEISRGTDGNPTSNPGTTPYPVIVHFPNNQTLQIPKKSSKTFIYHKTGWYNVGQMDQNV